jgi:2-polyprenyl-3-methyl-5-hydroxy-6-metoxy-1,4-benzoquinol methylase
VTRFPVGLEEKQRAIDYFQRHGIEYYRAVEKGLLKYLRYREQRVIQDLAGFGNGSAGKTMIDVGCGTGIHALRARSLGLHVTAVDVSEPAVGQLLGRVDVTLVADVEDPIPGTYDIVICAGVLDYVSRPTLALANLSRLVSPGGRLVIQAPREGFGGRVHAALTRRIHGLRVNLFTVGWLAQELGPHDLRLAHSAFPLPHNLVAAFVRPLRDRGGPT